MFFLFFILIPIIEVVLFITIGKYIGLWNTILIIIITGIIGAVIVRNQGIATLKKGLEEIKSNKIPLQSILEGIAILISSAFLLTPGFLTDVLGIILLIPMLRLKIMIFIIEYLKKKGNFKTNFKTYSSNKNTNSEDNIFEGKYEEVKDDKEKK